MSDNGDNEKIQVLVEMSVPRATPAGFVPSMAMEMNVSSLEIDPDYAPVPLRPTADEAPGLEAVSAKIILVRGTIDPGEREALEAQPNVVRIWLDTPIFPFPEATTAEAAAAGAVAMQPTPAAGPCPIPPCDCTFGNPANGTITDVATYLGVDQIWAEGYDGTGIVIGIVDGGIRAVGRPTSESGPKINRVIGGWPVADWGTTAGAWDDHGNMTATDALGMAPDAQIYDIRISDSPLVSGVISDALQGFQWAIDQHQINGTPHILSNSWGIFQESWDTDYATNPNHPFTRKVEDALAEGILVLFAAGNCGQTCPDFRCQSDNGPGQSIWGANGHPQVMTVGACNLDEEWVGYSSQGPAALDANKPDFCGLTHFAGYFPTLSPLGTSDGGTSAATPIVAGVVALMKEYRSSLTQAQAKAHLRNTAKNIGPAGWDQHSGKGIIQAYDAFEDLKPVVKLKFDDDNITFKFWDDIKIKFADDFKIKFVDDGGTLKAIEDVKIPGRDDILDPLRRIIELLLGGAAGGAPAGGATPFILSTPHHSMAWARAAGLSPADQPKAEHYQAQLAQYAQAIGGLEEAIAQNERQLADMREALEKLQDQQAKLVTEYKRLYGSSAAAADTGGSSA